MTRRARGQVILADEGYLTLTQPVNEQLASSKPDGRKSMGGGAGAKRPRKSFGGDGEYEEPSYTPSGSSSRPHSKRPRVAVSHGESDGGSGDESDEEAGGDEARAGGAAETASAAAAPPQPGAPRRVRPPLDSFIEVLVNGEDAPAGCEVDERGEAWVLFQVSWLPPGRSPSFNAINPRELTWLDTLHTTEEGAGWRRLSRPPPPDRGIALFARLATRLPPSKADTRRLVSLGFEPPYDLDKVALRLFADDSALLAEARRLVESLE